jgi:hypothetical protein
MLRWVNINHLHQNEDDQSPQNVLIYLAEKKLTNSKENINAYFLENGISNIVIRVHGSNFDWLVKQELHKLLVKDEGYSNFAQIIREADCMRLLKQLDIGCEIPDVIYEDNHNYLTVMSAGPVKAII